MDALDKKKVNRLTIPIVSGQHITKIKPGRSLRKYHI